MLFERSKCAELSQVRELLAHLITEVGISSHAHALLYFSLKLGQFLLHAFCIQYWGCSGGQWGQGSNSGPTYGRHMSTT